jgi:hypothetical protein
MLCKLNTIKTVLKLNVYSRDYWISGLYPWSGILKDTTFRKVHLLPSSGERAGGKFILASL